MNGNVAQKIVYFVNPSGNENHVFVLFANTNPYSGTDLYVSMGTQYKAGTGNGVFRDFRDFTKPVGNLGGANRGSWHHVEVLCTHETTAGVSANGTCSIWVDGVSAFTPFTDINWFQTGETMGWNGWHNLPIYGGGSNSPPNITPNIFVDYDQLYFSVSP